jgi:cell division transport system permease protein
MYALREALTAFRRSPVLTTLSAAMIALSLFVVGLFGLVAHNVRQVVAEVEARVEVVGYLRDDASPSAIAGAQEEIEALPGVRSVRYVSREEALQIARRELEELSAVFGTLDSNPLPASLEVSLHAGQRDAAAVRGIAQAVEAMPLVEEVRYGADWLDMVFMLRRVAAVATMTLGLGFAAVASLIIGAAIRMAIFARRDEIAIMRLVGATESFVRMPFLLEGFLTGLLGALLALGATRGVYTMMSPNVVELDWLPEPWLVAGLLAGALLGTIASAIAVRRHAGTVRG